MTSLRLEPAPVEIVRTVCGWIRSTDECRLWLGTRLAFPIDLEEAPSALEFAVAASWALRDENALVGFGQIVPKEKGRFHLARLIIDPDRRSAGHGRALVERMLATLDSKRCRVVSLNVNATNQPATQLYRSLGFCETARPSDEPHSSSLYLERTL